MRRLPIWPVAREVLLDTGGVHYLWLGCLTLGLILTKGGERMTLVCIHAVIGIVVIALVILLGYVIKDFCKFLMSKSKSKVIKTACEDIDNQINKFKDSIKHREMLISTSADESVRKMLRLQNDDDNLSIKELEQKKQDLKSK